MNIPNDIRHLRCFTETCASLFVKGRNENRNGIWNVAPSDLNLRPEIFSPGGRSAQREHQVQQGRSYRLEQSGRTYPRYLPKCFDSLFQSLKRHDHFHLESNLELFIFQIILGLTQPKVAPNNSQKSRSHLHRQDGIKLFGNVVVTSFRRW